MNIPLLDDGRVDIDALSALVDWSQLSAFESTLLTFQDRDWKGLIREVTENPTLATLVWNDGENLLKIAAHDEQVELANLLVKCGADVNCEGGLGTPVYCAVWSGNAALVDSLISSGANVNCSCEHGWSPLHLAARNGYGDIVQRLLEACADLNATDEKGHTPLDEAAQMHHADIVKLLIDRNAKYVDSSTKKFVESLGLDR
jgi:ankyrin repeat protein